MELDVYQQCPCHPEKKIKFCCGKEIVSDLSAALELSNSNQPAAALAMIDRLLQKHGDVDCLLTTKAQILTSLDEYDQAMEVNQRFLEKNPHHSIGLHMQSLLHSAKGQVDEAYNALQDAMDHLPDANVPVAFSAGFRMMGMLLLREGQFLPAMRHALVSKALKNDDPITDNLINFLYRDSNVPAAVKRDFVLTPLPEGDFPWRKKYENVGRAMSRGQFRKAFDIAERAWQSEPGNLRLLELVAIASVGLTDRQRQAECWQRLARAEGVPLPTAVEAQLIAWELVPPGNPMLNTTQQQFVFEDFDAVQEALLSDPQLFVEREVNFNLLGEGQPAPRHTFGILDRPQVHKAEDLTSDDLPIQFGVFQLMGRQTNSSPRLVFQGSDFGSIDEIVQRLQAVDSSFQPDGESKLMGQIPFEASTMPDNLHFPRDTARSQYEQLSKQVATDFYLSTWLDAPRQWLNGKSIRESVADTTWTVPIRAAILNLLFTSYAPAWSEQTVQALEDALGLARLGPFDPVENPHLLDGVIGVSLVDISQLSDEQLCRTYARMTGRNEMFIDAKICRAMIERPGCNEFVPAALPLQSLAMMTLDDDECFSLLSQARAASKKHEGLILSVMLCEFEQRLLRGRFAGIDRMLGEIVRRSDDDPEVKERLASILMRYGLLTPDGRVALPMAPEEPAAPASQIWTGDEPASVSGGGETESKLWIPGQ